MLSHLPDLEQIFSQHVDPIYRFFYRRVGNREDAEDLTSEVFLKASRQLDPGRLEQSIRSWLFTVARTTLADHWRRYYHTGASFPLDETRTTASVAEGDDDPGDETGRLVANILAALPERHRRVLELRFLRGYSVQETAEELALTAENVKVIQHRALARAAEIADERR